MESNKLSSTQQQKILQLFDGCGCYATKCNDCHFHNVVCQLLAFIIPAFTLEWFRHKENKFRAHGNNKRIYEITINKNGTYYLVIYPYAKNKQFVLMENIRMAIMTADEYEQHECKQERYKLHRSAAFKRSLYEKSILPHGIS